MPRVFFPRTIPFFLIISPARAEFVEESEQMKLIDLRRVSEFSLNLKIIEKRYIRIKKVTDAIMWRNEIDC